MLELPSSDKTVSVFLIDTGTRLDLPADFLVAPDIPGFSRLQGPSYSFLIKHAPTNQNLLFDLSIRTDVHNAAGPIAERVKKNADTYKISVPHDVSDVLIENGVSLDEINAIIWSHHHFDHTGNPSVFPKTTDLVVGPGFTEAYGPGYPEKIDAPVSSNDWKGRRLREINFDEESDGLRIGQFKALDYFEDGSFYLLATPGHTVEHVCGLARVQPDSFILMGGDCAHHPGVIRPSKHLPLPETISPSPLPSHPHFGHVCPGHLFASIGASSQSKDSPIYLPAKSLAQDYEECLKTVDGMTEFDALDQVLVVNSHDRSLLPLLEGEDGVGGSWIFPFRSMDRWHEAGLKGKGHWKFLGDFEEAALGR